MNLELSSYFKHNLIKSHELYTYDVLETLSIAAFYLLPMFTAFIRKIIRLNDLLVLNLSKFVYLLTNLKPRHES